MGGGSSKAHRHETEARAVVEVVDHIEDDMDTVDDKILCSTLDETEFASPSKIKTPKSDDICYLILKALKGKFIFESLTQKQLNALVDMFIPVTCVAGEIIIQQGTRGDFMYVIEEGVFEVTKKGIEGKIGECGKGDMFGELSLLYNAERGATITCVETGILWQLDRKTFKYYHVSNKRRASQFILDILSKIPLFKDLNFFDLLRIAEVAQPVHFNEGDFVIRKGEAGQIFYMILDGVVVCQSERDDIGDGVDGSGGTDGGGTTSQLHQTPSAGVRLKAGDWFGEIALLSNSVRTANVISDSQLNLLAFDRDAFENVLGKLKDLLDKYSNERMLAGLRIIKKIPENRREHAVQLFKIEKFKQGDTIAYCGNVNPKLTVIKSGEAYVWYHPDHPRHKMHRHRQDSRSPSLDRSPSFNNLDSPVRDRESSFNNSFDRSNRLSLLSIDETSSDIVNLVAHPTNHSSPNDDIEGAMNRPVSMIKTNSRRFIPNHPKSSSSFSADPHGSSSATHEEEEVRQIERASARIMSKEEEKNSESTGGGEKEHFVKKAPVLRTVWRYQESMRFSSEISAIMGKFLDADLEGREAKWRKSVRSSLVISEKIKIGGEEAAEADNDVARQVGDEGDDWGKEQYHMKVDVVEEDEDGTGSIDTTQIDYEAVLRGGDCVGDEPIQNGTPMDCTVLGLISMIAPVSHNPLAQMIAKTDVTCYVLAQTELIRLLWDDPEETNTDDEEDSDLSNFMLRSRKASSTKSFREEADSRKKKIDWDRLVQLCELGKGGFGKVYLMQDEEDKALYALKLMDLRGQMNITTQTSRIKNEISILKQMNSPYICQLHASAASNDKHFMLLEFIAGGEFSNLIYPIERKDRLLQRHDILNGKLGGMPHQAAKFYIATISLPLLYLHRRDIVYRDLKPENIMIDRFGYPKLVDFGLSKRLEEAIGKTFTLCGTIDFMAPEIILGEGHNQAVDWWALGVLLYEMIVGISPFIQKDIPRKRQEKMDIFERIVKGKVAYPEDMEDGCQSLIRGLLKHKPVYRMGCGRRGILEFEEHDWFRGEVDWVSLNLRQMKPPWVPSFETAPVR